ncbi:MAG: conjugal transfer protein TraB [Oligoflexia bacterium]|nr:conjugal transfer protein TraB [Oligoflexia bacterium]MBF0367376.1 conjugal transfer protein TraB [Oligoflexia bacterium]
MKSSLKKHAPLMLSVMAVALLVVDPSLVHASTSGTEFTALHEFVANAASGYLGKSIAIIGGLVGLGLGAATGKAMPAVSGVVLAAAGMIGPKVIDQVFAGAII